MKANAFYSHYKRILHLGCIKMHCVTYILHQIKKYKFGVLCHDALDVRLAPGPPEHEKWYINVSHTGCIRMHYMTYKSHMMQKNKFGVTCPGTLLVGPTSGPQDHEK
jgi:hypothetical protein